MRRLPLRVLALFSLSILTSSGIGQDKDKKTEEARSRDLPGPFQPYNVTGPFGERTVTEGREKGREVKGQYHCPVSDSNLDPGVLVFIRGVELDGAQLDLLQKLETAVEKNPSVRLHVTAVIWTPELPEVVGQKDEIDDKREELAGKLKTKAADLKLKHIVLSLASLDDLKGYVQKDSPNVVIFGYRKFRVEFEYALTNEQLAEKMKSVLDDVAAKLGARRQ
jgi:hypothetical protein